ncbi:hypothetical protein [Natribacillus halophilus]|nr:hypothetical protein [Natribacillus halophilus]
MSTPSTVMGSAEEGLSLADDGLTLGGVFNDRIGSLSTNLRGAGIIGAGLTSASHIWDYTLGDSAGDGGTAFASEMITDVGIIGGGTTAASIGSGVAAGALAGSAVPGIGTLVGAGVGLGSTLFMMTSPGQRMRDGIQSGVEWTLDKGVQAWDGAKNLASDAWDGTKNIAGKAWDGVKGIFGG